MKKAAVFMPLAAGTCWGASGIFVRTLRAADFNNITIMFSRAIVRICSAFCFSYDPRPEFAANQAL